MELPVVVVGAGVAGLVCALDLTARGVPVVVFEAADRPGGRVATDVVDGHLLDRGFQVLLTGYPEARRVLDYGALDLARFAPGALVRVGGRFHRVVDPWRRPLAATRGAFSPVGSLRDKWGVARLRRSVLDATPAELGSRPETTTAKALEDRGFSPSIVERFFRPFLAGVFLERELATSSRWFEYLFRLFATGEAAVPAGGMGEIPRQLAARLPAGTIRYGTRVEGVTPGRVTLSTGEPVPTSAVVVATDGSEAADLVGCARPRWNAVTCFQFAAERDPVGAPLLVLNGEPGGTVNDVAVMSAVAPAYAPAGRSVVYANVPGTAEASEERVRAELSSWWGTQVAGWRLLRAVRLPHALPAYPAPAPAPGTTPVVVRPGLYLAGDHLETPSLQGAMHAGRRAAEAVAAARPHPVASR